MTVPCSIEMVNDGGPTGELAAQVLGFWKVHGVLAGTAAEQRLSEVVCVLMHDGVVHGVASVGVRELALIGHRRFCMYRRFLDPDHAQAWEPRLVTATFGALEERFVADSSSGPIGLCQLVADPDTIRRHPEAIWPETGLVFAGYLADGRQVRIRYFDGATVG